MSPLAGTAGRSRCNTPTVTVVIGSYLSAIFPLARRELWRWRRRAAAIPDEALRTHALETLRAEHMNAEGAALFAVLAPPRWRIQVARTLVAYQTMYDYLDTLTELPDGNQPTSCVQLHLALDDALRPGAAVSDWYQLHPEREQGYLSALVATCRAGVAPLPSYTVVQPAAIDSARRATEVQTLNHRPAAASPLRPARLGRAGRRRRRAADMVGARRRGVLDARPAHAAGARRRARPGPWRPRPDDPPRDGAERAQHDPRVARRPARRSAQRRPQLRLLLRLARRGRRAPARAHRGDDRARAPAAQTRPPPRDRAGDEQHVPLACRGSLGRGAGRRPAPSERRCLGPRPA